MNISTLLDMAAEAFGERTAVVCGDVRLDYATLRQRAWALAAHVRASGAQALSLLDVSSPAFPVAVFAAAYAGVPFVPLNYRLTKAELDTLLARVTPAVLVVGPPYEALAAGHAGLQVLPRAAALALPAPGAGPEVVEDPRAVAVQLFTSGTTGRPKAAILRHENLVSYILGTVEFASAEEDDAILVAVPPYHIAGISAVLSSTYACRRMVQLENFDAAAWLAAVRREHVSNAFLVPTMLARIVDAQGDAPADVPTLKAIAYGGGKMPLPTIRKAMALFPDVGFTNAYGLTETSSTVAVLGPDDHRAALASADPAVRRRLGSVGKAAAVELQIRDDIGRVLGPEQAGFIFVRGPQVAGEYKEKGSQLDAEGWFPTKDRGFLDSEGYLFLDGRADDVIVRGGENISPGEIEDVLRSHAAVADAACVALADEQWGEAVAAFVVLKPGAVARVEELQAHVKGRLRSSRVPQRIEFRDTLPYNELGKLLRRVLRQELSTAG
ncbi:MAG: long-chain fatty acid--CoA ligase [Nevskiaceae bacterium]|nr:MAG: long-chain fatty acid--CoA ligase [Nevskiaceae bacterium]TBR73732.1 MAG: long-chain fatty acid--CoA ligase [Nevskiaceae bacterium]